MIRQAQLGDSAELATLLIELGYPSDPNAIYRRLQTLLPRSDCRVSVAAIEGALGGFGMVHIYPAIHADAPGALIAALVVRESLRGKGIGRSLVADLEGYARERGCDRIMVTTANYRSGAHRFYECLGYDFTGRRYAKVI